MKKTNTTNTKGIDLYGCKTRKTITEAAEKLRSEKGLVGTDTAVLLQDASDALAALNERLGVILPEGQEPISEEERLTLERKVKARYKLQEVACKYARIDELAAMCDSDDPKKAAEGRHAATEEFLESRFVQCSTISYNEQESRYEVTTKYSKLYAWDFIRACAPGDAKTVQDATVIITDNIQNKRLQDLGRDVQFVSKRALSKECAALRERMGWNGLDAKGKISNSQLKPQLSQLWNWMFGKSAPRATGADLQYVADSVDYTTETKAPKKKGVTEPTKNGTGAWKTVDPAILMDHIMIACVTRRKHAAYAIEASSETPENPTSVEANRHMCENWGHPEKYAEVTSAGPAPAKKPAAKKKPAEKKPEPAKAEEKKPETK